MIHILNTNIDNSSNSTNSSSMIAMPPGPADVRGAREGAPREPARWRVGDQYSML